MTETTDVQGPEQGWLVRMMEIRAFEDRVQELFTEGLIPGSTHLCIGQEAVSVGMISALGDQDLMTVTYRGHGHALARGMSMRAAFAEILGRETGCCGGVGGSMHLTDPSLGLLGSFAIVGAGYPVAVGAAMGTRLRGEPRVAMAFCGDGATNIGTFHESLNMAAVWSAPVVFVVENNRYAEYTPLEAATAVEQLELRGVAHGMEAHAVDGQDIGAVSQAAAEAVSRARDGGGPTLLVANTYRYRGHSRSDPAKYRPAGELEEWLARDPIQLLADRLIEAGAFEPGRLEEIGTEVQRRVDEAADAAKSDAFPTLSTIEEYVYA